MAEHFAHVHFVAPLPVDEIKTKADIHEILESCFEATNIVIELRGTAERNFGELNALTRNSKCEATSTLREESERQTLVYEIVDAVSDVLGSSPHPEQALALRTRVREILDREFNKGGRNAFFADLAKYTLAEGTYRMYRRREEPLPKPKSEYPHSITKKPEDENGEI